MPGTILTEADLLSKIEAFCRTHDMKPSTFGRRAVGDGSFIANLHDGRSCTLKVAQRVVDFMTSYRPEQADAA